MWNHVRIWVWPSFSKYGLAFSLAPLIQGGFPTCSHCKYDIFPIERCYKTFQIYFRSKSGPAHPAKTEREEERRATWLETADGQKGLYGEGEIGNRTVPKIAEIITCEMVPPSPLCWRKEITFSSSVSSVSRWEISIFLLPKIAQTEKCA